MKPGEVWEHPRYLYRNGAYIMKYIVVLSSKDNRSNPLIARITKQSNGLPSRPPCYNGNPKSGFYLGMPGGKLQRESWVTFQDIHNLDDGEYPLIDEKIIRPAELIIKSDTLCSLLRCVQQNEDITNKQYRQIGDTLEAMGCA